MFTHPAKAMPPSAGESYTSDVAPMPEMHHFLNNGSPRAWLNSSFADKWQPGCNANTKEYQVSRVGTPKRRFGVADVSDVTIYVGKHRAPYVLSIDTLRSSSYFRSLLQTTSSPKPIVLDCEEFVFQNMMTVLRYGSLEALPKMSDFEMFKLRKELEFYGIQVCEPPSNECSSTRSSTPSSSSKSSSLKVARSSRNCRPQALEAEAGSQHLCLTELPDFPMGLTDPAKLVLVSLLDHCDERGRCPCSTPKDKPTSQWALNFHYMHAFCTGCGRAAAQHITPKLAAEMFMVTAAYYSRCEIDSRRWSVGCDSTCTLKFLSCHGASCCNCTCCYSSQINKKRKTVWAVSSYYSHAFCTRCGKCADNSSLVCILLTSRYGRLQRSPKSNDKTREQETACSIRQAV